MTLSQRHCRGYFVAVLLIAALFLAAACSEEATPTPTPAPAATSVPTATTAPAPDTSPSPTPAPDPTATPRANSHRYSRCYGHAGPHARAASRRCPGCCGGEHRCDDVGNFQHVRRNRDRRAVLRDDVQEHGSRGQDPQRLQDAGGCGGAGVRLCGNSDHQGRERCGDEVFQGRAVDSLAAGTGAVQFRRTGEACSGICLQ